METHFMCWLREALLRQTSYMVISATPPTSVFHTRLRRCEMPNRRGDTPRRQSRMKSLRRKAPGTKGEKPRRCFSCVETGHTAKNCPQHEDRIDDTGKEGNARTLTVTFVNTSCMPAIPPARQPLNPRRRGTEAGTRSI